jgi:hypothetical protein
MLEKPDVPTLPRLPAQGRDAMPQPTGESMPAWLRWWRSDASYPVYVFVLTRLLFVGVTFGVLSLLHSLTRLSPLGPDVMVWSWHRWDVEWFTRVAAEGYTSVKTSAFFPLTPLLMRVGSVPLHLFLPADASYFIAGVIVSNAAFLGALIVLYRYVAWEFNVVVAQRVVLYLAIFPKALFTFTAYSESLFLLLAIASFALMRRGRFGWAGLLAGLATLDRLSGLALLVPFAVELWVRYGNDIRRWLRPAWTILPVPAAVGSYSVVLALAIGDPLGFSHAESAWGRHFVPPPLALGLAAVNWLHLPFGSTQFFNRAFDLAIGGIWLLLLVYALLPQVRAQWKLPASLIGLGIALTLLPLAEPLSSYKPDLLSSMSRYLMTAFPIFIIAGLLTRNRPRVHEMLVISSVALLVVFTAGFITGYYVV